MGSALHHSSSSSLVSGGGSGSVGVLTMEGHSLEQLQQQQQQQRPHQLPLHSSSTTDVNGGGGGGAALTREVKTWNPFEDSFTQMAEDHLFGQEFDKIRQQGSQSSELKATAIEN